MVKRAAIAAAIAVAAGGCGGSTRTVTVTTRAPSATRSSTSAARSSTTPVSSEVLAVPAIGGFYGRCPRGARVWTLRFLAPANGASETVTFTLAGGPMRRSQVDPGRALTFRLVPGSARVRQPADPMSGNRTTTVATTEPLDIHVSQVTEPQFQRLDISLALAASGGEAGRCALVESRVSARTYSNAVR